MRKSLFMLGITALTMTACSNTDVIEEGSAKQAKSINFDTHINKSTRAVTNDDFREFYVYGSYAPENAQNTYYTIFNGVDAVKSEHGSTGPWTYNNTRYWIPKATYKFYACSDDNKAVGGGEARATFDGKNFSITSYLCDKDHQNDLVFAETGTYIGQTENNPTVAFTFQHILSRLNFIFSTTFAEDNIVEITNFRVNNIRNIGNFNYGLTEAGNEWAWDAERNWTPTTADPKPTVRPTFGEKLNTTVDCKKGENATSNFVYVIPFKYTLPNVDILFDITVRRNKNEDPILQRSLKATWTPQWEIGKSYTYNVLINGESAGVEPIVFSVKEIQEWESVTPKTPDLGTDAGNTGNTPNS